MAHTPLLFLRVTERTSAHRDSSAARWRSGARQWCGSEVGSPAFALHSMRPKHGARCCSGYPMAAPCRSRHRSIPNAESTSRTSARRDSNPTADLSGDAGLVHRSDQQLWRGGHWCCMTYEVGVSRAVGRDKDVHSLRAFLRMRRARLDSRMKGPIALRRFMNRVRAIPARTEQIAATTVALPVRRAPPAGPGRRPNGLAIGH